ncbi:AsmA family protein [Pseudochrobactrum saccharolyticum]|uniref:AsmA family protein n=1 Tax=Pseudochrobactrum saccharolyticum TaxID=354352 RepID=UPI002758BAA3|nr:AsmA family protein [Pseudochrobactrum saccharolyticum]MDP8251653.1 AsmA family protein [Pseudochrobactrum saccharolyticum]
MKLIRPVLAVIVILAMLFAGALAALPYIVSTDSIRLHLAQNISAWTGYSVEIRQPPRMSFFPVFRASLSDVTVSKMGDTNTPFMAAERIEVEMSPLDALFGRVAFTETRLINAHFALSEPVEDLPQFVNTLASSSGRLGLAIRQARNVTAKKTENDQQNDKQLQTMPFGRLVLENSSIGFTTRNTERQEQISKINASIDWPQTTSAATVKGKAVWHDETVDYNLNVAQPLLLLARGMSQMSAQITSKPLTISFDGRSNISENIFTEGAFSLSSPSLSESLHWVGLSSDASYSLRTTADDAFSIETNVSATPLRIKLSDIALNLNNMPAKGAAEIGFGKQRPVVTGTLAFQTLNAVSFFHTVTTLVTKVSEDEEAKNYGGYRYAPPRMIDTRLLNSADLDIRLSAQNASIGAAQMTGLAAALQIRDGQAIFDIGDAKAFKGSIQTSIKLSQTADGQDNIGVRLNAANIDSAAFLTALGLNDPILSGQGNLSVTAETSPQSLQSMLRNARGQISFTLNNGRMLGFDLNDFIAKMKSEGFFALQRRDKVSLDFKRLDVKASLGDGVATLETTKAETMQGALSLTGIIPLTDRSLALSGTLTLPQPAKETTDTPADSGEATPPAPVTTPEPTELTVTEPLVPPAENLHFFVGGSWDRPFISPSK